MSRRLGFRWYAAAGLAVAAIIGMIDEGRGLVASAVAWTLCLGGFLSPPRRPRVAVIPMSSKITGERRVSIGLMPFRMMLVLGGAASLYHLWGDHLGVGFWIACLVFYPIALTVALTWTLADLKRPD